MGINVKATERNVSFEKNKEKWAYVMMPETYSTLAASKVIDEASIRSGIPKGSLNASWAAIGDVVSAWTTEGHSVAIPGLGYIRFGIRSTSVPTVNEVSTKLISLRRVIFTPCSDIRKELASTPINITCYDRNGKLVKRVNSSNSDISGGFAVVLKVNDEKMGSVSEVNPQSRCTDNRTMCTEVQELCRLPDLQNGKNAPSREIFLRKE